MRTIDATLLAALQAGDPKPYIKAYLGYEDGSVKGSYTKVPFYRLTGTSLEFIITTKASLGSDQETIWLERGVTIAGTNYTVTTGRFFITEEEYLDNQFARYKGTLFPPRYYSAAGDVA